MILQNEKLPPKIRREFKQSIQSAVAGATDATFSVSSLRGVKMAETNPSRAATNAIRNTSCMAFAMAARRPRQ